ncbi:integrator complex subunit 14-like [Ptychodera flava]|uniref:integrator complex subunit 14-like n=1 Tax=Ptychodera flava TaxID=63121 RepID=UPI00396AA73E
MPNIILLDVSLSMARPLPPTDGGEEYQRRHLAQHGITSLLDYMATHSRLEFTSLAVFSSLWELKVPFTRDYNELKNGLLKLDLYDKTKLEVALAEVKSTMIEEWSSTTPCQLVLVTDGRSGVGQGSLRHMLENPKASKDRVLPIPFPFPCKIQVMLICNQNEAMQCGALNLYQKLIDVNGAGGSIHLPEGALSLKSVQQMFMKFAEGTFAPFYGTLHCGHLKSDIQLSPTPEMYTKSNDFEVISMTISSDLELCGFMDIADICSPPIISRHLVLPTAAKDVNLKGAEEEDTVDEGKTPSFCVLLHGSLKVENMVALAQLGPHWYGMLYSWADSKKKSNLMLSIFEPGDAAISWLGKFSMLGPCADFDGNPYGDEDTKTPFPVRPAEKRSYAQNSVVWVKASGLQADIQKILRQARKLPDKQQAFYKELNRLRKAALTISFYELLEGVAAMLERECTLLPGTAHPDAALQLTHATKELRLSIERDITHNITPLQTNFTAKD